jgi:hypothetical protein
MAEVVHENLLRRRSLRAQVAFAARCARRVLPLVMRLPADFGDREAVEQAIGIAERFALGKQALAADGGAAAEAAGDVARAAWDRGDLAASYAAHAAYYAADAGTPRRGRARASAPATAASYAYTDAAGSAGADRGRGAFDAACASDLAKLARLRLGTFPELGKPIDPSENGPLGPLWPNGEPEPWPAYRKMKPLG